MRWWSRHHLENEAPKLLGLVGVAALLYLGAGVGMAYVAGFGAVRRTLEHPTWWWLPVSLAGVALSFVGYYFGYRSIGKVEGGPDDLATRARLAVVAAGFGGFLAHGGSALDDFVMRGAGGMVLFWICDMFALWAALAAFGYQMNIAAEMIAFGTAMIVTRRTGPLGGAGILMCALPPTLWQCGVPWAPAVLGTFAWRFFTLWAPMPFSFLALPTLRALGETSQETPGEGTHEDEEEPALQH